MSEPSSEITLLNTTNSLIFDPAGKIIHRYFKSTFNSCTPPYAPVPFYLENYNPTTKKFHILVLTDRRQLGFIPIDYPLIPITEQESQILVDHCLSKSQTKKQPMIKLITPTDESNPMSTDTTVITAAEVPKAKAPKRSNDGRQSIRSIIIPGLDANKSTDQIVADVQVIHPERTPKEIKGLISVVKHSRKEKAAKVQQVVVGQTAAPAMAPETTQTAVLPAE